MSPDMTADASGPPGAIEPTARRRSWPGRAASLLGRLCGPDADDALPNRYRLQVRAGLLDETLKLATYSAVTHLIIALAVAYFFWGSASHTYLLGLLAVVAVLIAAATYATWLYWRTHGDTASAATVRWGCRISAGLAFALGLAWATLPVVLFAPSGGDARLLVVAIVTGLISDAYVVGPLLSVSYLFAVPVIVGSFVGLARSGEPVALSLGFLLAVYAIFVVTSVRRMSRLSRQRILDRVRVGDQSETIGLLLNAFEANASDWLWETDGTGRFQHVSTRMADVLACPVRTLQHASFPALLAGRAEASPKGSPEISPEISPEADQSADLLDRLRRGVAFHQHLIAVDTPAGRRWLRLSGKPFLDQKGRFAGFRGVGSDVTEARRAEAHIAYLATRDPMTGLSNRVMFHDVASEVCAAAAQTSPQAPDATVSLLYLDLDGFKTVNDSIGHAAGDALLGQVADRLRALLPADAQAFRLGGDEFAILQRGRDGAAARALAEATIGVLREPYLIDGVRAEIGVSVGIACAPADATEPEDLLRKADLALYSAKQGGKGRWRGFDRDLEVRVQRRHELDEAMRQALADGEMALHYQPLVGLQDGQVVGCEALLRWTRPGLGPVSPAELIPIAEGTGFILAIGRWALRRACAEALTWPARLRVAVNISSVHFRRPDFFADVAAVLSETGLAAERLEIEITESIFLANTPHVLDNLRALRALGVRIALDDFGTGYSSLSYLTQFPVDKIKIDRAFVRDLSSRPECLTVIEAIMVIARDLRIDVTVEGVETEQQAELLRLRRCNSAQGFLYSPARPPEEIPGLIERLPRTALPAERAVRAVA
ncbi:diguanylate cyclase (GGDEF)-like protein [Methylobacterium sp. PvP062]|jgi:diguanylate cyclase (GGDEF)-like protein|nr:MULTISPECIES: EAL domain-containing protein [Methylobacterium]MBP2497322.1 diguanylate cyclase (GGDEF)-like protein [Methylobacterium sp. PvP105]MBP2502807.1 diguanylate cyclase (GGDEF)-like protein [Methylobacterium sp. PvP109]